MASSLLSPRRRKFYSLVRQANERSTDWLQAVVTDQLNNGLFSPLHRLACLRILACRSKSGLPYPQRKAAVRFQIGIPNPRWVPADESTREIFPGAILMTVFQSEIHVPFWMTITANEEGKFIPMHGSVKMAPEDSVARAKDVLLHFWLDLPDTAKLIAERTQ